ncbi:MAG: tyrosine-type recombinase/integrase [Alphaproteobacteria bacterium]|nr:tyrosine-type recombinase/integrase [Alphaproteobacteria bacterium]
MAVTPLKYLVRDRDRHGNVRVYVRLPGQKKIRLRSPEGTPEFHFEYATAIAAPRDPIGASKRKAAPGTMRQLILNYIASRTARDLAPSTRNTRRRILDRLDAKIGDYAWRLILPEHIARWRDAPDEPEAGNHIVKTLRAVFRHAQSEGCVSANPAASVAYRRSNNPDGYTAWSEADFATFVKFHPRGTMAHKALCLFLFTGQRLSDVRRMGPQHVCDGWLVFTQQKNRARKPVRVELPIIEPLQAVLDDPPSHQLAFITSERGTPFQSDASFGNRFIKWCKEAGLEGRSAHGIRKGCASILASLGLTDRQIMAVTGHVTSKEIDRYTAAANRRAMAESGLGSETVALELARLTEQKASKSVPPQSGSVPLPWKELK